MRSIGFRYFLCFIALLGVTPWVAAQNRSTLHIEREVATGEVNAVINREPQSGSLGKVYDPVLVSDGFLASNLNVWGLKDLSELVPTAPYRDSLGMQHVKYYQRIGGLPVIGGELIVHLSASGGVTSVTGRAFPSDINIPRNFRVSESHAIETALTYWKKHNGTDDDPIVSSVHPSLFPSRAKGVPPLNIVWSVSVAPRSFKFGEVSLEQLDVIVSAETGEVLRAFPHDRQLFREVWDCSNYGQWLCVLNRFSSAHGGYRFGRSEGAPERGPNPLTGTIFFGSRDVDGLYDLLSGVDHYWLSRHNRDGANKLGGTGFSGTGGYAATTTRGFVHIDAIPSWGLNCRNASWGSNRALNFCLGMVSPDVVAHEYTHGVFWYSFTDANGNAIGTTYYGETASLEEGASDYFGEAFEFINGGTNDWKAGTGASSGVVRDLANPPSITRPFDGLPYPDRFYADSFYCGTDDFGGAHHNATVFGKALYLMTMGGKFNGCGVEGINREKVEKILYRAATLYFTRSVTYNQAVSAMNLACKDLYSAWDCIQVSNALKATEMDQGGKCSGVPRVAPTCDKCFLKGGRLLCLSQAIARRL